MINSVIADKLKAISVLLDLEDKTWESRAYRDARATINDLSRPVAERYAEGGVDKLKELPSIGSNIASIIADYLETGSIDKLSDLQQRYPEDILRITEIRGIGPSTTRTLLDAYDIKSADDLLQRAKNNELQRIDGVGATTENRVINGLEQTQGTEQQILLADADTIAQTLLDDIDHLCEKSTWVGGQRRRQPVLSRIELLVHPTSHSAVIEALTDNQYIASYEPNTTDPASFTLIKDDHDLTIHFADETNWGSRLHDLTGPQSHLEQVDTPERAATEQDVYDATAISYVVPEQRHNTTPVPEEDLIKTDDIRGDLHVHSDWSDGRSSIPQIVATAERRGHDYIAITDHSQSSAYAGGLSPDELQVKNEEIDAVDDKADITVLRGSEVDILPDGSLDYDDEVLSTLDVVVASIHSHFSMDETKMTERIITAIQHEAVTCIGHLTGRLLLRRDPYPVDVEAVLQAAAENDVAVEINSTPVRLDISAEHAAIAKAFNTPIMINTDSHHHDGLNEITYGVDQARRAGLNTDDVVNTQPLGTWLED